MMTHVNKIGFPGSYSLCIVQSLLQILVGMVRLQLSSCSIEDE